MINNNLMTLEEMRQHEWVVSWSGGKDSTSTIILMHENKIPVKKIIYVRMMYDEKMPATLPKMIDFVLRGKSVFESWGYPVEVVPSIKTALQVASTVYHKSKYEYNNGNQYGISAFLRGGCKFTTIKQKTIEKQISDDDYQMIGYAVNEYDRVRRLRANKQSILVALNIFSSDTYGICRKYNLLSPLYNTSFSRDGCFFCPNANKRERESMRAEHPELIERIDKLISMTNRTALENIKTKNHWLEDYFAMLKEQADPYKQVSLDFFRNVEEVCA